ncbi:MAG TPA: hypothetical protein VKE49_08500 [Myxococcaceae bacterium]|nr:hypothetical protein [Myxococcaceae bacterium]
MGGIALIAGSVGSLLTMAFHPSGRDFFVPGQLDSVTRMNIGVHALAIASMPFLFLGALALSRRLSSPDRLAIAGLVVFGFALAAGMAAGTVSGFVAPSLAREIITTASPITEGWRIVAKYNGRLNHAFAAVLAVASSGAIVLWSASIVKNRALALGIGIYGLVLGPAIVIALVSGLPFSVHGFGLVILGQTIWFIAVGILLWRPRK